MLRLDQSIGEYKIHRLLFLSNRVVTEVEACDI